MEEDEGDEEDVYEEDNDDDAPSEDGGSDYGAAGPSKPPKRPTTRKTRSKAKQVSDSESVEGRYTLTTRQRKECRVAFALFFPVVGDKELSKKRLLIKDIAQAARSLNQRLATEEVRLPFVSAIVVSLSP